MKLKPSFKKCTVKTEGNYYINYPQCVFPGLEPTLSSICHKF